MGHSFGGGAMFGVAYARLFYKTTGEAKGRFCFHWLPWYSYQLTPEQLNSFPADTKLIAHVYEEDVLNDHHALAMDIFNNINISKRRDKDYIYVQPAVVMAPGCGSQPARHLRTIRCDGLLCLLPSPGCYVRLCIQMAMCRQRIQLLANGSSEQITMPTGLKPLQQSDEPQPRFEETFYEFPVPPYWIRGGGFMVWHLNWRWGQQYIYPYTPILARRSRYPYPICPPKTQTLPREFWVERLKPQTLKERLKLSSTYQTYAKGFTLWPWMGLAKMVVSHRWWICGFTNLIDVLMYWFTDVLMYLICWCTCHVPKKSWHTF